jgi:leucyl/phenylalanyl-tRNA---protein transferase
MQKPKKKIFSLTPVEILNGYANGIFPMGDSDDTVEWYSASPRAIVPVKNLDDSLNISRSLRQVLKKDIFEIKINTAFKDVITLCSQRSETWINKVIIDVYTELNRLGYAHSIEAWKDGNLAGGLYGVALRGAFFGESMFYKEPYASKVCVVKLYEILKKNKYLLFDIQMMTPVFKSFGAVQIPKKEYLAELKEALEADGKFEY